MKKTDVKITLVSGLKAFIRGVVMALVTSVYTLVAACFCIPFVAVLLAEGAGLSAESTLYAMLGAWFLPCAFVTAALFWLYVVVIKKTWCFIQRVFK